MKLKSLIDMNQNAPMDEHTSKLFLQMFIWDGDILPPMPDFNTLPPALQIMIKRLEWAGITETSVSIPVKMFLACICETPGDAVLWCYTIKHMLAQNERVDMNVLTLAFPFGFPTKEAKRECWDAQKGCRNGLPDVDNLIDDLCYWGEDCG